VHLTDQLHSALAGRYLIERHLGAGGLACAYLCWDCKHDQGAVCRDMLSGVVSVRAHKMCNESARMCLDAPKTEQDVRVARLVRTFAHN
jgi:hypothetical protein